MNANNQVTTFSDVVADQAGLVSGDSSPRPHRHLRVVQVLGNRAFRKAWLRVRPAPKHCPAYTIAFFAKAQEEKSSSN